MKWQLVFLNIFACIGGSLLICELLPAGIWLYPLNLLWGVLVAVVTLTLPPFEMEK